jgi:DNA-binding CsgD family transcriptional regulator
MRTAQARYWRQDGLEPADGARKISDSLSRREWHRQEFYAEVARPLGVEHMMRLWIHLDGSSGARVEFDRADKDFTERDREALDLLLPHLRRAVRMHGEKGHLVTRREREVLALVGDGYTNAQIARTLWISTGTVRKHLENAYEKLGVHTRTGAVAALGLSARGVERKTADR